MKVIFRVVLFLAIFVVGVRFIEQRSIYYPLAGRIGDPADRGLEYKEVYFNTSDGKKINAWYIPGKQEKELTVLFSNGNAGNISYRLDKISILHNLGLNVLIYDYRGYGKSQGSPSEAGLYKDIRAAYNYLRDNLGLDSDSIILYGESLGGAVAVDLASQKPVRALITEGTFTSVKDMARRLLPFIPYFLFSSRFDSLTKIADLDCQKLIIHSKEDEIVPFSQGKILFEAASWPKNFLKLRGGHNTAFLDSGYDYQQGLSSFFNLIKEGN